MSRNYLKDVGQREEAEKYFWNQGQQRPQGVQKWRKGMGRKNREKSSEQ